MRKEALGLSLLIAISILYFDLVFFHGYVIAEKYGSEIQKTFFRTIDKSKANAQITNN